jgi:hypothetical protein
VVQQRHGGASGPGRFTRPIRTPMTSKTLQNL